jgi:hypothetical protein
MAAVLGRAGAPAGASSGGLSLARRHADLRRHRPHRVAYRKLTR